MITVEIFEDGSALKTWYNPHTNVSTHAAMSPNEVRSHLEAVCLNSETGCGSCLTCATKTGQERKRKCEAHQKKIEQYIKDANAMLDGRIDTNDYQLDPNADVEMVDGGAWVTCRIWVYDNEMEETTRE